MKKRKVFRKLFIIYIVIVLLYTLIGSAVFFYKHNQIGELELRNNQRMFLRQAQERIDTKFTVALNLINQFTSSEELTMYARDRSRDYYNITRVYNNLVKRTQAFNDFGFSLDIVKKSDDLVISSQGTMQLSSYYTKWGLTEPIVKDVEAYIESNQTDIFVIPETVHTTSGELMVMVKKEKIYEVQFIFYILFYVEDVLPQLDSKQTGFSLIRFDLPLIQVGGDELLREQSDSEYYVHREHSRVLSDVVYSYVTPRNAIQNKLFPLIADTAQIYIILLLFGIVLSFFAARNMYKPIRSIVNVMRGDEEHHDQDEFSFIKESAIKMKEVNKSLTEMLQNNRLSLKHKFLRDLLGGMAHHEQIAEGISLYELHGLEQSLSVIVLEFVEDQLLDDQFTKDAIQEIKTQTMRLIEEQLNQFSYCQLVEWDYKRYVLIMQETEIALMKKWISQSLSTIEIEFEIRIVAAIGQSVPSAYEMEHSLYSAFQLLDYRFAIDKRTVITTNDLGSLQETSYIYPLDLERDLISYCIQGKEVQVNVVLQRLFQLNFSERTIDGESLSKFISAIIGTVHRVMQQASKSEIDIFGEGSTHETELKKCENAQQILEKIQRIFHVLISKLVQVAEETDNSIADEMIAFVHDHYDRDISLTDLAEQFNFSPGYISILFKNYVGENYKDYLNLYRVNKAKEIYNSNHRLTVNEIGERVGFNHVNTFIRIFKKYEGVSPGQYFRKSE